MKNMLMNAGRLVVMAALVAGCGQDGGETAAEKVIEKAIESSAAESGDTVDAKVDVSGETVTISMKGEDSEAAEFTMGAAAKLPDDFPKDVPVYPGMKFNMTTTSQEDAMFMVSGSTPDSKDKVVSFFKEKAAANGWTEQMSMDQGGLMHMLMYEKADRMLSVTVAPGDNGATINLTTGNQ